MYQTEIVDFLQDTDKQNDVLNTAMKLALDNSLKFHDEGCPLHKAGEEKFIRGMADKMCLCEDPSLYKKAVVAYPARLAHGLLYGGENIKENIRAYYRAVNILEQKFFREYIKEVTQDLFVSLIEVKSLLEAAIRLVK